MIIREPAGVDIAVLNCWNNGMIQRCIESIKANTTGAYNLIVVDQDSKDGSREWLIDQGAAAHLILNKRNVGAAEGRNQAIRAGRNPWIIFLDSDIELQDKDWLDKVWNFTIDRRIGLVECRAKNEGAWKFSRLSFCMIRRECLNEIGLFDRQFIIGEDLDFMVRIEYATWWTTGYCDNTIAEHKGAATITGCLASKRTELEAKRDEILTYKYTKPFLTATLGAHSARRLSRERELEWAK